jgi:hypothetical protein
MIHDCLYNINIIMTYLVVLYWWVRSSIFPPCDGIWAYLGEPPYHKCAPHVQVVGPPRYFELPDVPPTSGSSC